MIALSIAVIFFARFTDHKTGYQYALPDRLDVDVTHRSMFVCILLFVSTFIMDSKAPPFCCPAQSRTTDIRNTASLTERVYWMHALSRQKNSGTEEYIA